MTDRIFCKIIKGDISSFKIYEDDKVFAFLDIAEDYYGHTLVVSKQHCTNILDCDSQTLNAVMHAVQKISRHYVEDCGFQGVNVINNSGECSGQSVMHFHVHILPRKSDDGVDLWPAREKLGVDLKALHEALRMK